MFGYPKVLEDNGGAKRNIKLHYGTAELEKVSEDGDRAYYLISCPLCSTKNTFSILISNLREPIEDVHINTIQYYNFGYVFPQESCKKCGIYYKPRVK